MMKKILSCAFLALTLGSICSTASASESIEIIDVDQQVQITVIDNIIHVSGASGQTMVIYNLAGVRIKSVKVDGADKRFDLNLQKGCYIVQIGKVARKITIK